MLTTLKREQKVSKNEQEMEGELPAFRPVRRPRFQIEAFALGPCTEPKVPGSLQTCLWGLGGHQEGEGAQKGSGQENLASVN